jgi:hypothetical protein
MELDVRASPAVSPTSPQDAFFSSGWTKTAQPRPRFLVFARIWLSSVRRAQAIPSPPGSARGLRTKLKRGKRRENFPRGLWPQLVGDRGQSSCARFKSLPPVRLRRTRRLGFTRGSLYLSPNLPRPLPSPVFSPQSTSTSEQWRATAR